MTQKQITHATLHIMAPEEIELYLRGTPQEVDKLILMQLNNIASVLIPYAQHEEAFLQEVERLGGMESVRDRAQFVDSLIEKNKRRGEMFNKVATSGVVWALLAFLGMLVLIFKEGIIELMKRGSH